MSLVFTKSVFDYIVKVFLWLSLSLLYHTEARAKETNQVFLWMSYLHLFVTSVLLICWRHGILFLRDLGQGNMMALVLPTMC